MSEQLQSMHDTFSHSNGVACCISQPEYVNFPGSVIIHRPRKERLPQRQLSAVVGTVVLAVTVTIFLVLVLIAVVVGTTRRRLAAVVVVAVVVLRRCARVPQDVPANQVADEVAGTTHAAVAAKVDMLDDLLGEQQIQRVGHPDEVQRGDAQARGGDAVQRHGHGVEPQALPHAPPPARVGGRVQRADEGVQRAAPLVVRAVAQYPPNHVHAAEHQQHLDLLRGGGLGRPPAQQPLQAGCVARRPQLALERLQQEPVAVVQVQQQDRVVRVHDLHLVVPQRWSGHDRERAAFLAVGDTP